MPKILPACVCRINKIHPGVDKRYPVTLKQCLTGMYWLIECESLGRESSWCNTFSALHVKDNSLEDDGGDSVYVDCVRGELVSLYCA